MEKNSALPNSLFSSDFEVITSADGSHTLYLPVHDETYHSRHGAIQESRHVFIEAGFKEITHNNKEINILEMGFGTGLNALLTIVEAQNTSTKILYTALEAYPVPLEKALQLNYPEQINIENARKFFEELHKAAWNEAVPFLPNFILHKLHRKLEELSDNQQLFDLIYYDAFAPRVQPELWTEQIFSKIYSLMAENGILVTYCAKGYVRRNLHSAGFKIEKLQGPPGKREMLRARKN